MSASPNPAPSPHVAPLPGSTPESRFLEALRAPGPLRAVELRPPPSTLDRTAAMEAWIDAHHGVGRLLGSGRFVLFTDDAVGSREEESLAHLTANLGPDADLAQVVPFLTCKHSLEYCLLFARRAASHGFGALTVTGGDPAVGLPRCVPRSRDLRIRIREGRPGNGGGNGGSGLLPLGAWVNPVRDPREQVGFLQAQEDPADYFLTQVVSHHDLAPLDRFLEEAHRQGLAMPGLVGVFHYRSANPTTLARLARFLPVPAEGLRREFDDEGLPAAEVTARTLRALAARGVEKVYLSNLALGSAASDLRRIEARL
ncbi:MAG: hypothetical protein EA350_13330 [Gemmatimonadales bacterium]|nr:MAG: hypothetical protein EA350_13330 [Gemmatimonadales bacterium]